jgi:Glucose / Sorbosone dehydrogenase
MRHVSSSPASRKPVSTTAAGSRSGRTACSTWPPATRGSATALPIGDISAARYFAWRRTARRRQATRSQERSSTPSGTGPDGQLYEAEFGQNTLDEINLLQPGGDYGWPTVEGTVGPSRPGLTPPLLTWDTDEASPSGLAFAGDSLWLATLQGKRIYRIPLLGPGRVGDPTSLLDGQFGRLRTAVRAPDGSLWVTTSNRDGRGDPGGDDDRIIRVPLA